MIYTDDDKIPSELYLEAIKDPNTIVDWEVAPPNYWNDSMSIYDNYVNLFSRGLKIKEVRVLLDTYKYPDSPKKLADLLVLGQHPVLEQSLQMVIQELSK